VDDAIQQRQILKACAHIPCSTCAGVPRVFTHDIKSSSVASGSRVARFPDEGLPPRLSEISGRPAEDQSARAAVALPGTAAVRTAPRISSGLRGLSWGALRLPRSTTARGRSNMVLGQPGAQVPAAGHEPLGDRARRPVRRMLALTVAATAHRERVLPAGHMTL
jgi:hypothetical protein